MPVKFDVIYEDNHCLAVCKPSRLLTVSDESGDETLLSLVRDYNASRQQPGKKGFVAPVHMIDRPVSGLVLFAVSSKAASRLSDMFRQRKLEKIYLAVVEGIPAAKEATLVDWLAKDREANTTRVVASTAREAKRCELSYQVLSTAAGLSLLLVRPVTGRSHQIRVQLAHAGFRIYGDRRYGSKAEFDGAIALHAYRLELQHPVTKEPMSLRCPPPAAWQRLLPAGVPDV
jgi:23S rRNA pseudouridine1911/1915/1917 synthase